MFKRRPGEWWLVNTDSLHMISRRDDCNIHFITTYCCSNVLIDGMESMTLFYTLDFTRWAAWGDLLSTWKHKYSLPSGGKCVVFGNATGKRGKLVINGVKRGGIVGAWTLIFCFRGVTQEWTSSVFEMSNVFWMEVLSSTRRSSDLSGVQVTNITDQRYQVQHSRNLYYHLQQIIHHIQLIRPQLLCLINFNIKTVLPFKTWWKYQIQMISAPV